MPCVGVRGVGWWSASDTPTRPCAHRCVWMGSSAVKQLEVKGWEPREESERERVYVCVCMWVSEEARGTGSHDVFPEKTVALTPPQTPTPPPSSSLFHRRAIPASLWPCCDANLVLSNIAGLNRRGQGHDGCAEARCNFAHTHLPLTSLTDSYRENVVAVFRLVERGEALPPRRSSQ